MKKSLKSLEDFWYCIFVVVIQICCLYHGFANLHKYNTQSWKPYKKPDVEICIYAFFLCLSILLLPLFVITSLLKVGSYANDNFKFAIDLEADTKLKKSKNKVQNYQSQNGQSRLSLAQQVAFNNRNSTTLNNPSNANTIRNNQTCSTSKSSALSSSFTSTLTTISAVNNTNHASYSPRSQIKSHLAFLFCCSPKYIWKYFPPLSSFIHVIISFCILYPNVLLIAKEIEYGLRPKGYIHYSELDFVFSRPLKRLGERSEFNNIKYQLVSSSIEDTTQVNYEPQVSIELINHLFALVMLSLRFSSTLWHLNKIYSIIFSLHIFLYSLVSVLSFGTFQILYKFQMYFSNGIKLTSSGTSVESAEPKLFSLPFALGPKGSGFMLFLLSFLMMLSSVPIYTFGIFQYDMKFRKLKTSFNRYFATHSSNTSNDSNAADTPELNAKQTDALIMTNEDNLKIDENRNNFKRKKYFHKKFLFYAAYRHHIYALMVLVVISICSAINVYDHICLYQLTTDPIPLWSTLFQIVFILWYIILWLILTFKTKWKFEFSQLFKLNYWQYLNKVMANNVAPASSSCSSSSGNAMRHNLATPLNFNNLDHDCDSLHSCIHATLKKSTAHRLSNGNLAQSGLIMMQGSTNPYNVICDDSMKRPMSSSQTNINSPLSHELLIMNQQALENLHETSIDGSVYENDGNRYSAIGNDVNVSQISALLNANMPMKSALNQSLKNLHSLNRKQPSLRRLNQILASEQKLAPVFENFNVDQFKKPVFEPMSSSVYNCEEDKQRMMRSWTPDNENLKFSLSKPVDSSTIQKTSSSSHLFGHADNNSSILEETLAIYNKAVNMNRSINNINVSNANCSRLNFGESASAIYESSSRKAASQSAENIIAGELQLPPSGNSATNYELLDFNLKSTIARLNAQTSAKPESMESLKNGGSAKLIKMRRNEEIKPPSDAPLSDKNNSYKMAIRPKLSEIFGEVNEKNEGEKSPLNAYEAIGLKRFLSNETKANQEGKNCENEANNTEMNAQNGYIPLRSIQKTPISSGINISATNNVQIQALMVNQDTDSGRHSMTDSPCSLPPNDGVNQKAQNEKNSKANNVAGTFTSKCTLSSGTAVTISQTKQKLQQKSNGAADSDDNDSNGKRKSLNVNMMVSSSSNGTSSNRDTNDKQSRSVSRGRVNSTSRKSSEL